MGMGPWDWVGGGWIDWLMFFLMRGMGVGMVD
jgi:hypothetical protein